VLPLLWLLALCGAAFAVDPPGFSVEHGVFDAAFTLTLSTTEPDGAILYSLDSGTPTLPYTGPLTIDQTTVVRALQESASGSSSVATRTYIFPADVAAASTMSTVITDDPTYGPILLATLSEDPSISIALGETLSSSVEKAVSAEWIDPEGSDGGFQVDCGARLVGYTSLGYAKKNIRLYFRSDYGEPRLEYPIFDDDGYGLPPSDSYDALSLRSSHDSIFYLASQGQYLRNIWMDQSQLEMGHTAPHGRFVHVYVNGGYRGVYHLRERFDDAFMADYLGGEEDDYEAINAGRAVSGTGAAWSTAVASASDWATVSAWVDVPNFLDYMILNYYAANDWDWLPSQNWMAAGPDEPGQGGFRFHSSDSDICLVYPWDQNILDLPGPSYLFQYLLTAADPDFLVLLEDRIHADLEGDAPLSADRTAERYERLAASLGHMVVGESARWGSGWWDRDDEWDTERNRLLDDFFPFRTDEQLRQFREVGWYPLDAPVFSRTAGTVAMGDTLVVSLPSGSKGELYVTENGYDPRESGGAPSASAIVAPDVVTVTFDHSTEVKARLRSGEVWGPLEDDVFEVDEAPPVILNEWNAVDPENFLSDHGSDTTLGRVQGNGGDWMELVVVSDHTDLRGWRITLQDRRGPAGDLRFTEASVLSDLRSGTILTIAEDMPEDASYDPSREDWRLHLQAAEGASGTYISASGFDVSHSDWQFVLWDAEGHLRFGPAGEGVSPRRGVNGSEVGLLKDDPSPACRRDSSKYHSSSWSSFGAPNVWEDGSQDLEGLRHPGGVVDIDDTGKATETGASHDTAVAPDSEEKTGESDADSEVPDVNPSPVRASCGCTQGSVAGAWVTLLPAILLLSRRRRLLLVAAITACHPGTNAPTDTSNEDPSDSAIDSGSIDSDTGASADTDTSADTSVDSDSDVDCWADVDRDDYGDPALPVPDCSPPSSTNAGDCDDAVAAVHPGAFEVCDDVDDDCDGLVDDADPDLTDGVPFWSDADGDGYGGEVVTACHLGPGYALSGGDCDDADATVHPDAVEGCDGMDRDCDGIAPGTDSGAAEGCPAASCLAAEDAGLLRDGPVWITLPSGTAAQVWCDQSTDGGGWTLGLVINSVADSSYAGFGGSETEIEVLSLSPEEASTSSRAMAGWLDLNAMDWDTLRVAAYGGGALGWISEDIPRSSLRIDFGLDGYLLYGGDTPYYWCGGAASYTDAGVGATDNPPGASLDCKGHGSLGSGWDFSEADSPNAGLTLCGGDGSSFLASSWGGGWVYYPSAGGAQVLWVR
jgi:hypothetical protein